MAPVTANVTPATPPVHRFRKSLGEAVASLGMSQVEFLLYGFYLVGGIILMYSLACLIRSAGLPGVNLAISGFIGLYGWVVWFSPIPLLTAIGIGSLTAASKKVTLDQGVKQGLELLGRLAATSILFASMVFGFYGTWPGDLTMTHYLIGFTGPIMLTLLIIYDKVQLTGKWWWWVGGSYTGAIMAWYFGTSLPFVHNFVNSEDPASLNNIAAGAAIVALGTWLYFRLKGNTQFAGTFLTIGIIAGLLWLMGADNLPTAVDTVRTETKTVVDAAHNYAKTGDTQTPDEKKAAQEAQKQADLDAAKHAADLAAVQKVADAAANAKAAEAARLVTDLTEDNPPSVTVPKCSADGKTWSEVVKLPPHWSLQAGWGGKSTKVQYMHDGEWKNAMSVTITESVEAFRYCTTSDASVALNPMPLAWSSL